MNLPILFAAIPLLALTSCSAVKQTVSKVSDSTTKTFRNAKEKALGTKKPSLRLTKADPSRFLPKGTTAEQLQKTEKANPKARMLLAKNTRSQGSTQKSQLRSPQNQPEELPEIELPPLPEASSNDDQGSVGILPSLEGNGTAFIDVDGESPELPPLEIPDFEEDESESE